MSKLCIINGQNHNLQKSGGVGRICDQLLRRLSDPRQVADNLGDSRVIFHNLGNLSQASNEGPKEAAWKRLNWAVSQCCPPIFLDALVEGYRMLSGAVQGKQHSATNNEDATTIVDEAADILLLHELTNYSMHKKIGRLCLDTRLRLVVTFADIQDYYYPQYFDDSALRSRRLSYTFYKERADHFFAISEFTKQTMIDRLEIEADRITVTPLAADDFDIVALSEPVIQWVQSFGRFWLYPAKAWRHKNHETLFRAMSKRVEKISQNGIKLLLTGGFSNEDVKMLRRLQAECDLEGCIEILGFISKEQMQGLLRNAEFLFFPSLYEGFGMPILEAMACGCPVISSNAASLPEVGGDAAIYFDPKNEEELVAQIDAVLDEQIDRLKLIERGYKNSNRFKWQDTFEKTVNVYRELLQ